MSNGKKDDPHGAHQVPKENLYFHNSLTKVAAGTGVDEETLLSNEVGFCASPSACICKKHKWSSFDIVLEAVSTGKHDWNFFAETLQGEPGGYFARTMDLTCQCGKMFSDVHVLYKYKNAKSKGWGY